MMKDLMQVRKKKNLPTSFKYWIKKGQNLSQKDFLDLMEKQFGDKTKEKMKEMLKEGKTMEEVNNKEVELKYWW